VKVPPALLLQQKMTEFGPLLQSENAPHHEEGSGGVATGPVMLSRSAIRKKEHDKRSKEPHKHQARRPPIRQSFKQNGVQPNFLQKRRFSNNKK
jgi:hypothetical protein